MSPGNSTAHRPGTDQGAAPSLGIGVDLVQVDRLRSALSRHPKLRDRLFTESERSYSDGFIDPAPRLAARFAAKEAAMKALGVGLGQCRFSEIEVVRGDGPPTLELRGRAAKLAGQRGFSRWRVSLTHTDTVAEAVVLAAGQG